MKRRHSFSRTTVEAAALLGTQVAAARRERRWSAAELAERAGISTFTLSKVEKGDPTVGLGVAFEVAVLVGVPLFVDDRTRLAPALAQARDRLAVLPQRVRAPVTEVDDDF